MKDREAAARRLQRCLRRYRAVRNWRDPLTLEPVTRRRCLQLVEAPGCVYLLEPEPLARYLIATGDFANPLTRRPLLRPEVLRLKGLAGRLGRLLLPSLELQGRIREAEAAQATLRDLQAEEAQRAWRRLACASVQEEPDDTHQQWLASGLDQAAARLALTDRDAARQLARRWAAQAQALGRACGEGLELLLRSAERALQAAELAPPARTGLQRLLLEGYRLVAGSEDSDWEA